MPDLPEPPIESPLVVALMGLPGAGKSTLARALASALPLRIVDRDAIRAALFPRCGYTPTERRASARAVLLALEVNLALGHGCVVDGMTFSRRRERERVAELAARLGARCVPLLLELPPALAEARVAADTDHSAGDRDVALVRRVAARFEPVDAGVPRLDAAVPADALVHQALALLAASSARPGA
jgi:predicted kinase